MKYTFKNIIGYLAAATTLLLGYSCTEDEGHERYVLKFADSVTITYPAEWIPKVEYDASMNKYIPLYMGCEPLDLDYVYTVEDGHEINTDTWEWYSNDTSVVEIDADGIVYPVGAGTTTVYVKALATQVGAEQYDILTITVAEKLVKATEITVSGTNYTFEGGCNLTLTAAVTKTATDPLFGSDVTYKNVTWYSSNPSVADIDEYTGVITTGYIPGGLESLWIDFYAVAVDGSGTEGKLAVELRSAVPPTDVYWDATTLGFDGKRFSWNSYGFTINYTMEPAQGTPNLISWTSSDPDAVTVTPNYEDGTAYVEFLGYTTSVTITATCEFSGNSQEITFSIPSGYYYENFSNFATSYGTENLGDQWYDEENECLQRIADDQSSTVNGTYTIYCRSDMSLSNKSMAGFNSSYPIFAIRMWDVLQYEYCTSRNFFINWAWYTTYDDAAREENVTETYRSNEYTHYYKLNDNSQQFIVWDMSQEILMGQYAWYPSGPDYVIPGTFTIRYQDLVSSTDDSDLFPFTFQVYEFRTFQSTDELETYITDELGMTYTKEIIESE